MSGLTWFRASSDGDFLSYPIRLQAKIHVYRIVLVFQVCLKYVCIQISSDREVFISAADGYSIDFGGKLKLYFVSLDYSLARFQFGPPWSFLL